MKKMCFYIDSMQLGGANRVVANLANHFSEESEIVLINDIVPIKGIDEYETNDRVKRIFLGGNSKYRSKIIKTLLRVIRLRRIIKNEEPDVIVSFMGPPNIRMLISSIGLKCRKIVSVRNDPYKEYGTGVRKIIARMLFNLADGCVFQTVDASCYFSERIRQKSSIIYNPVKEEFYDRNIVEKKKEIIMVGRLQVQKNPEMGLCAFAKIADKYPDYTLVFYGNGELISSLKDTAKELKVENRVLFAGQTRDVTNAMKRAEIFLLTSDYEGMPNALMEAMAIGLPVISTDCPCGGPRTLITNKECGVLVNCRDVDDLSQKLDMLLADKELRNRLSKFEKERAEEFRPEVVYKQWQKYLFSYEE